MPHGAGLARTRLRTCPVYFSTRDNLPGHLAICVNNIIIMCIGLIHDIFTRNIYDGHYGIDRKIDAPRRLRKGLCGHAPSDHREQIVELFENTARDC